MGWDTVIITCFCVFVLAFIISVVLRNTKYKSPDDFKPWPRLNLTGVSNPQTGASYPDGVLLTGTSYPDGVNDTYHTDCIMPDIKLTNTETKTYIERWKDKFHGQRKELKKAVDTKKRLDEIMALIEKCYVPWLGGYLIPSELQKDLIDAYEAHENFKKRTKNRKY